jgi:hypothetical protein
MHPRQQAVILHDAGRNEHRDRYVPLADERKHRIEPLPIAIVKRDPYSAHRKGFAVMEESNQISGGYEGVAVVEEPLNATGEQTPVGIVKVDRCNHARTERNRLRSPDFATRQYAKSKALAEYISNERQAILLLSLTPA